MLCINRKCKLFFINQEGKGMRFSSKGRYAIASLIYMAQKNYSEEQITILSIARALGISKIYLEQVFSMLKRAGIVASSKGSQGGYRLAAPPGKITVGKIARAVETSLFEKTGTAVSGMAESIDRAMDELIWERLDNAVASVLDQVTLLDLADKSTGFSNGDHFMFFI